MTTQKPLYVKPMQENILVDLSIVLDVLLERSGFTAARKILELSVGDSHKVYISAHFVTTFAYLLEEAKVPLTQIHSHIKWLIETFKVVAIDNLVLKSALKSRVKDYEDAVVEQTAIVCNATTIITRNVKDFIGSTIPAARPEAYLNAH